MKKLFYIVLTIVVLSISCLYLKKQTTITPENQNNPSSIITTEENCVCKSECICPQGSNNCECNQTKSICSCKQQNGKVITIESIESNNDNIEENNPDQTSDEGETVL